LVTTFDPKAYPARALARLYRERADAENISDKLKSQWGRGDFTTKLLAPTQIMANTVALTCNRCMLSGRMFDGGHHGEAATSRAALLEGVGRMTKSGGRRTLKVSLPHEKRGEIQKLILNISRTLHSFSAITEGWEQEQRWACLLTSIFRRWLGGKWLGQFPAQAEGLLIG
jgi:hypothetical protein